MFRGHYRAVPKATLAFAAAFIAMPGVSAPPSSPPFRIGVGRIVPVAYMDDNGKATGFAVDVVNEAARREGVGVRWQKISGWLEDDLDSGKIDLISAGMATAERKHSFFVSEPWWSEELALLTRADFHGTIRRLGIQKVYAEFARPYYDPKTYVFPSTNRDGVDIESEQVCSGELDATLITHGELHDLFLNRPKRCEGIRLKSTDTAITYGLSIISRKADESTAKRLRKRIDDLVADGTLLRLANAHPPIPTAGAVRLEERLREQYRQQMWVRTACILGLVFVFLIFSLWNRQRSLSRTKRSERELRRLHWELQRANERLTLKHEVARIGSFEWFVQENRVEWSPELAEMYGRNVQTLEGWKHYVHPADLQELLNAVDGAIQGRLTTFDATFRILRPEGETIWIHSRGRLDYDHDQPVRMFCVNMDITEIKQVEGALRQTNAQLEALLDSVPEPMMVTDASGNVLRINSAFRDSILYRTTIDGYAGHVDLFTEDGRLVPAEQWPINRVRRGEKFNATDFVLSIDGTRSSRRYSGTPVIDTSGNVTHAVLTFFDITDQKRMAQELRRANETMSLALDAVDSGAWAWNLEANELSWTQSYYRLFGLDSTIKPSLDIFYSLVHPNDRPRLKKNLEDAVEGRVKEFNSEFRVPTGEGVRWFERRGRALHDDEGRVVQLVGITTDVTERKAIRGLLPTCSQCKKIRDEHDQWHVLEKYISDHSEARLSHGLCPECLEAWAKVSDVEV